MQTAGMKLGLAGADMKETVACLKIVLDMQDILGEWNGRIKSDPERFRQWFDVLEKQLKMQGPGYCVGKGRDSTVHNKSQP